MVTEKLYLRQNVLVEPLFNQWYAWAYLISPATSAMYISNLHLKIMRSFVANPQIHISALKNPAMIGGPFINYDLSRLSEVQELIEETEKDQTHMIEFAQDVNALNEILRNEAKGYSLQPLYQQIPENLKGYVEIVYDLNNNPLIRFLEGLLYKSKYYNETSQSLLLSTINQDSRSFALSNPKLKENDSLHIKIPFKDERIDELFKTRYVPQPLSYIKEMLEVKDKNSDLLLSFFTDEKLDKYPKYDGDAVRIRYFGHACILIETEKISILCDPAISYKYKSEIYRYTIADIPESIDYVLLTHNHQDHVILESLLMLRHKIKNLIVPKSGGGALQDPSMKLMLESIGFKNVREIDEMEEIKIDDGTITGLPFFGEHADLDIRAKIAHLIRIKEKSILCAADSNNLEPKLYQYVHNLVGDLDVLFIGMECDGGPLTWLYGPLLPKLLPRKMDQSRRFDGSNYEKAINIVEQLHPKEVYVYAMGHEPWFTYMTSIVYTEESRPIVESNKLVEDCRGRGLKSERLFAHKEIFL
ncbi:polyketide synthase [Nostocales cyanobacterium HT-58-2]|nr:polyketide synthase [Nostocales cyanobacterium HT-58-2]